MTEEQTISKWELSQSTPELGYISRLSDVFGVTTDYLIKGDDFKDAEQLYEEIVSKPKEEANQIIYIEREANHNSITPKILVGIAVAILGVVLSIVGVVKLDDNGDWIMCIIAGIIIFIVGIEQILIKKHPVLASFWTIWIIGFLFVAFYVVNSAGGSGIKLGFNDAGEIANTVLLIYFIVLTLGTLFVVIGEKSKQNKVTDNSL